MLIVAVGNVGCEDTQGEGCKSWISWIYNSRGGLTNMDSEVNST